VFSKILNGAKPAELPIEQSIRFELAVNLTTAKESVRSGRTAIGPFY
jgi:hypothetical protein